jgi:hypothetical protein
MPNHAPKSDAKTSDEMQSIVSRLAENAAQATTYAIDGTLRSLVVVPAAAFALHLLNPEIPWWPCCGIVAFSLLTMNLISGAVALVRKIWHRALTLSARKKGAPS